MNEANDIRKYYRPNQPTVSLNNKEILYQEVRPDTEIENFIYCFWRLKTNKRLNQPYVYKVVSDGCIDIFFNNTQPSDSFVMGFCRKYVEFPIGCEFDYVGVRFLPSFFPLLFGVNAKTLSNQSQGLEQVLPNFSQWISSKIEPFQSFDKTVILFNSKVKDQVKQLTKESDQRFFNALYLIFKRNGYLDVEKDLDTGLSSRQLQRIFNFYIGTTPKAFCNVVRFQYILNAKPTSQSLKKNKIYFDVGFFDQAHFIKSFKNFYGVTPSEAFK